MVIKTDDLLPFSLDMNTNDLYNFYTIKNIPRFKFAIATI